MKVRLSLLPALVMVCLFLASCAPTSFTIVVETRRNVPWSGTYMVTSEDGKVTEYTVSHVGPYRLTVEGKSVLVRFRKGDVDGVFRIETLKNGLSVANSTTYARNGEVVVAGQ